MAINIQTSRGTVDLLPSQVKKLEVVEQLLKDFCLLYGYNDIRTPIFEDTKVFKRENDSSDMVNKEMYTFTINNKDYITLRPEGTASIVRSIVQNKMYANAELPLKLSYYGPMFRYERPQKGRQRQFHQFGIENIGLKSPLIDAETIAFGYSFLKALGINDIKVLINTLGDSESRENYKSALKEYFKPELLNRIDEIITFNPLSQEIIYDIVNKFMKLLNERLNEQQIRVVLTDEAKAFIAKEGFDPTYGARPLKRFIQRTVETKIARAIIASKITPNQEVVVDMKNDELYLMN